MVVEGSLGNGPSEAGDRTIVLGNTSQGLSSSGNDNIGNERWFRLLDNSVVKWSQYRPMRVPWTPT